MGPVWLYLIAKQPNMRKQINVLAPLMELNDLPVCIIQNYNIFDVRVLHNPPSCA